MRPLQAACAGASPCSDTTGPDQIQQPEITPTLIVGAGRVTWANVVGLDGEFEQKSYQQGVGQPRGARESAFAALAAPSRSWPGVARVTLAAGRALGASVCYD